MVNTDNCIEEEIKERIAAGNRAHHVLSLSLSLSLSHTHTHKEQIWMTN
jgi:hypothetical protein